MKELRCSVCKRLLAKQDDDGVLHVKSGKGSTEILVSGGRVHLICPSVVFGKEGKVQCGSTNIIRLTEKEETMISV